MLNVRKFRIHSCVKMVWVFTASFSCFWTFSVFELKWASVVKYRRRLLFADWLCFFSLSAFHPQGHITPMRSLHLKTVEKYTADRRNWLPVHRCYRWRVCFEVKSFSAKGMCRKKKTKDKTHSIHRPMCITFLFSFFFCYRKFLWPWSCAGTEQIQAHAPQN